MQKDLGSKILLDINEVFADVFNVTILNGGDLIKPDSLVSAKKDSQFHVNNKYHEQRRDVAKYWKNCEFRIAFLGIESERKGVREMPLRIMSYDGGAYREQIMGKNKNRKEKYYYPVISLVLNFDTKRRWSSPKSLKEVLKIPSELEPLVNDYKIHVVDVAFLERKVIDSFKSDFWFVADYFWQIRNNKDYKASKKQIKKAHEVLQMMSAITGDNRFEKVYNEVEIEGGAETMCEFLDKLEARGETRGKKIGKAKGKKIGKKEGLESGIRYMVETCFEVGVEKDIIEEKLMSKFNLSQKEAKKRIEKYGNAVA